jgi:hypothetical protein
LRNKSLIQHIDDVEIGRAGENADHYTTDALTNYLPEYTTNITEMTTANFHIVYMLD